MKIEKAIAASLEPLLDFVAALDARLKLLEVPTEIEVPIDDVAAALKADAEFLELTRGAPGENPQPLQIDYERIIAAVPQPVNGAAGIDGAGITAKQWAPGIYREGEIVQHDMGRYARALRDTGEQPGTGNDWERIGAAGFRWCGVKKDDADYQDGDFYIDDGTTFLLCDGKPRMFCRKGRDGKAGKDGSNGKDYSALIGELKIWPGVEAPDGFLLADGSTVPEGEKFNALRALVGEALPDWSSEFLVSDKAVACIIIRAWMD